MKHWILMEPRWARTSTGSEGWTIKSRAGLSGKEMKRMDTNDGKIILFDIIVLRNQYQKAQKAR